MHDKPISPQEAQSALNDWKPGDQWASFLSEQDMLEWMDKHGALVGRMLHHFATPPSGAAQPVPGERGEVVDLSDHVKFEDDDKKKWQSVTATVDVQEGTASFQAQGFGENETEALEDLQDVAQRLLAKLGIAAAQPVPGERGVVDLDTICQTMRDQFGHAWTRNEIYRGFELIRWLASRGLLAQPAVDLAAVRALKIKANSGTIYGTGFCEAIDAVLDLLQSGAGEGE